jgi:hypothetical protein
MHMIPDALTSAQPTTTKFRIEERTIDGAGKTLRTDRILNTHDRETGWDLFRQQLILNADRYKSGTGRRLVLVETDGGDR